MPGGNRRPSDDGSVRLEVCKDPLSNQNCPMVLTVVVIGKLIHEAHMRDKPHDAALSVRSTVPRRMFGTSPKYFRRRHQCLGTFIDVTF